MKTKKENRLKLQIRLENCTNYELVNLMALLDKLNWDFNQLKETLPDQFVWERAVNMHTKWNQIVAICGEELDFLGENFDFLYAKIDEDEVYGDMPLTYHALLELVIEMNQNCGYTKDDYRVVLDAIAPFELPF